MQWRKLFDRNPLFSVFCDKLAVRGFIADRVGDAHLVPLVWTGGLDDLPADVALPYVLKANHGCAQVLIVRDGGLDVRTPAAAWLGQVYGAEMHEWGYGAVPRRLMIETLITNAAGGPPVEQRLFVFDGKVAVVNTVFIEDGRVRNGAFHDVDWRPMDWYFSRRPERDFPRPERLAEMVAMAEILGAGIDHARVDFYDCGAMFWVGEITVYPWSGLAKFNPDDADLWLGKRWRLPRRRFADAVGGNHGAVEVFGR